MLSIICWFLCSISSSIALLASSGDTKLSCGRRRAVEGQGIASIASLDVGRGNVQWLRPTRPPATGRQLQYRLTFPPPLCFDLSSGDTAGMGIRDLVGEGAAGHNTRISSRHDSTRVLMGAVICRFGQHEFSTLLLSGNRGKLSSGFELGRKEERERGERKKEMGSR